MRYGVCAGLAVIFMGLLLGALLPLSSWCGMLAGMGADTRTYCTAPPRVNLAAQVAQALPESGVEHPVTAVLLNFRGYDTLLEVAVLLLAALAATVLRVATTVPQRPAALDNPLLSALAAWLFPLMVVVAFYLLWAGAYQPGGAFQAGAVLAAGGVLLRLASIRLNLPHHHWAARGGLVVGLLVFVAVATVGVWNGRPLLTYPRAWAGEWILLVESALMLSIGLILVSLFEAAPVPRTHLRKGAGHEP